MTSFIAAVVAYCLVFFFLRISAAYSANSIFNSAMYHSEVRTSCRGEESCDPSFACSLAVNATDANKFRKLIFDNKALVVFLLVTVANGTKPLDGGKMVSSGRNGEVLPSAVQVKEKWAWLRNKRGRFLATLPYDFDILSLTTLTREAYDMSLKLAASPVMCYGNMSRICLERAIALSVMNATDAVPGSICTLTTSETSDFRGYCCCDRLKNGTVLCNTPIQNNEWIDIALRFLWALAIGFGIFAPLLFKYLPKEFRRGPRLKLKSQPIGSDSRADLLGSQTSVEPMTANYRRVLMAMDDGMLDVLRTRTESILCSRLSRCAFIIALCCLPVLQGLLYGYLKKAEIGVSTGKLLGVGDAFITLMEPEGQFALSASFCFCTLLICIAVAIPKTLSDLARRLSGRRDERTFLGFRKPDGLVCFPDKRGFQLMYENMVFHLNSLLKFKFWKFVFLVVTYPLQELFGLDCFGDKDDSNLPDESPESENTSGLCSKICKRVLLLLIFPAWAVTITTAFVLYILPVTYVAFRIWKMLFRVEIESPCCNSIPNFVKITAFPVLYVLFIVFCMLVEASYFVLVITLTINIMFLGSVAGFTVMGLLFYIEVFFPQIVLGTWVIVYTLRGINKYYAQFTRLKVMVFEECEKYDNELRAEASIRETFSGPIADERKSSSLPSLSRSKSVNFLVFSDECGIPSIPVELFLKSSQQLMPFRRTLLAKLLKVVALGSYLVVVFLFVMSLMQFNAASAVVQGLAILLLGALPLFALKKAGYITQAEELRSRHRIQELIKHFTKRSA